MNSPRQSQRQTRNRFFLYSAFLLIGFNFWHNTTRSTWNFSVRDSLTIGPNVIDLAHASDPGIRIHKPYDGQFYYAISHDPLILTKKSLPFVDKPQYRYRRILLPFLAHVLVFGKSYFLPFSLFAINIIAWFLCGVAAYRIAKRFLSFAPLAGIGVLITTGLSFAAFRTLSEPLGVALALWGITFWLDERKKSSLVILSLAGLARETTVLIPFVLSIYAVLILRKSWVKQTLFFAGAAAPTALWTIYLLIRLDPTDIPLSQHMGFPYIGMIHDIRSAAATLTTRTEKIRTYSVFVAVLVVSMINFAAACKRRSLWGWLAVTEALFCSILYGHIWNYYASSARVAAPLMIFSLFWYLEIASGRQLSAPLRATTNTERPNGG